MGRLIRDVSFRAHCEDNFKMWSIGVNGRCSAFREQQRLLFAMEGRHVTEEERAMQRQLLMELTTDGNCRGMVVDALEDREALLAVRAALQQTCNDNTLLSRTHFVVVGMTPAGCKLEAIAVQVEKALATMQLQQLDMLLLHARSLSWSSGLYARKQTVLEAWEHMMAIQQAGLVEHIGISDLSIQDVDFLVTAYPDNPPEAWSIEIQLTTSSSEVDVPLEDVAAFAHAHSIDVLARFPFDQLGRLEPQELREEWDLLTQNVAERFRERPFKFMVAHENEGTAASHHLESHTLGDTKVMQTPVQIAVRYFLQIGLIIIPQGFNDLQRDGLDTSIQEEALREIFGLLAHPFTAIHPSCSPHKLHSSILTRDDLAAIDRALSSTTSFPTPAPPHTPISTSGKSRPCSTQERRVTLPAAVSRPPTAE